MEAERVSNNYSVNHASDNTASDKDARYQIAVSVIQISVGVLAVLGLLAGIAMAPLDTTKRFDLLQYVFAAIIPVVGTWVGAILAFYFSKENLNAANRSVSALVKQITSQEKLQSITARQAMIPKSRIISYPLPSTKDPKEVKLSELLKLMHEKNITRLPILNESNIVKYVFHRSVLDGFVAEKALSGAPINPPPVFGDISLADLVNSDSQKIKRIIEQASQFVRPESNLETVLKPIKPAF